MRLDLYTVIHITYTCVVYIYTCMFSEGIPLDSSTVSAESLQPWRMTVRQSILESKIRYPSLMHGVLQSIAQMKR